MRILIYGITYSPELTGIGIYTGEMASWLAQRGHEVRVVTAPPYYPAWSIREDYYGKLYRTERVPGQPVVYRTPLYVPAKHTGLQAGGAPLLIHAREPAGDAAPVFLETGRRLHR